jgi:uncharacterized membrane protein
MDQHPRQEARRLPRIVIFLAMAVVVLSIVIPPWAVVGKADVVAFAICHRIAERTFWLGGRPLPLCARCSGTYLGVMATLIVFLVLGRRRASQFPRVPMLLILVAFIAAWAIDGLNSYLSFFPTAPKVYEPRNWLRLATGLLNGTALTNLVVPVFNFTLWADATRDRALARWRELAAMVLLGALLAVPVLLEVDAALVPLAAISGLGVLAMLLMINAMIAAILLRRDSYATTWRQSFPTFLVGAAITSLELAVLVGVRAYATLTWGLPF